MEILQLNLLGWILGFATALGLLFKLSVPGLLASEKRHKNSIYFIGAIARTRRIDTRKAPGRAGHQHTPCSDVIGYYFDADQ